MDNKTKYKQFEEKVRTSNVLGVYENENYMFGETPLHVSFTIKWYPLGWETMEIDIDQLDIKPSGTTEQYGGIENKLLDHLDELGKVSTGDFTRIKEIDISLKNFINQHWFLYNIVISNERKVNYGHY